VCATTLLYGEKEAYLLIDKLEKLFLTNPPRYRLNKPPPPRKNSSSKSPFKLFQTITQTMFLNPLNLMPVTSSARTSNVNNHK
jgi:hypothetical protein